jgi:hypothetical protein
VRAGSAGPPDGAPGPRNTRRLTAPRPPRTDQAAYEWDRLSPDQQQAVLVTISDARSQLGLRPWRPLVIGFIGVVVLLACLGIFMLATR